MTQNLTRRGWIEGLASASAGALAANWIDGAPQARASEGKIGQGQGSGPVFIGSDNGYWSPTTHPERPSALVKALERIRDPALADHPFALLEAIVDGVGVTEDDPLETGVGLGGMPNEEGVVQLDASCMFGPTHQAGSVAAIENIKNPARAAMYVLRYTDHCMLVGDGAYKFARAFGLPHTELLTEKSRQAWLYWKQQRDKNDDWLTPPDNEVDPAIRAMFTHGTIHVSATDGKGVMSAVTTTSGLAYKIPGRIGDSPVIGAGMWCDNDVGSAGGTGRGEEMIVNLGAHTIVEGMRNGLEPVDACLKLLERVASNAKKRGLMKDGLPTFGLTVYALRKDGVYASAALTEGTEFAVADGGKGPRRERCAWLFDKK